MPEGEAAPQAIEAERRRRRHPVERTTSRFSGLLLLLAIPHAAFGYALVDLVPGPGWVRSLHFALAPLVLVLALLLLRSVLRLPWRRARERGLFVVVAFIVALSVFQLASGLWMRWGLPEAPGLTVLHVGTGILNTLLVALAHVVAILPSILLSAREEHARLLNEQRRS